MKLKETIDSVNIAISEAVKVGNIKAYGITERLTVDKHTYLKSEGNTVSIDDNFDAVLWHRLGSCKIDDYNNGRGATEQKVLRNKITLVCYSKKLDFFSLLLSVINSNNSLKLLDTSFDKESLIKRELPEAYRNFNIDHYFFAISYEAKEVLDGNCLNTFCF